MLSRSQQYEDLEGYTSISFKTVDNLSIQGWYTQHHENLVIIVHGHWDHSKIMQERYESIFADDFDILFIDLRNHGRSDAKQPVTLGVNESKDVCAALEWVNTMNWKKTILWGTSMGAIAALLTRNPPIDAYILGSAFLNHEEVINMNMQKHHLPGPYRQTILWYMDIRIEGFGFPNILERFENISIPCLYLHGDQDIEAPISIIEQLNNLNNSNIVTVIIEGGEHSRLFEHQKYHEEIIEFLEGLA
ncbi:MAG: alpha/beta hydrolase [Candidatus Heimdallarchaeota archaeon]|nr:alpha/beta hydrolase [Candidatus Heimdallarchaeota archaeon]